MNRLIGWVSGILGILGLAFAMRGRLRGRYARWRMATAYGDARPPRAELWRDAVRVGAWRRRMARLARDGGGGPRA